MTEILLFAGTTEGRQIAEALRNQPVGCTVSVATEYGEALIEPAENIRVLHGRRNTEEMAALMIDMQAQLVIDATHPYAVEATKSIADAAKQTQTDCIRVTRASGGSIPEEAHRQAKSSSGLQLFSSHRSRVQ